MTYDEVVNKGLLSERFAINNENRFVINDKKSKPMQAVQAGFFLKYLR